MSGLIELRTASIELIEGHVVFIIGPIMLPRVAHESLDKKKTLFVKKIPKKVMAIQLKGFFGFFLKHKRC